MPIFEVVTRHLPSRRETQQQVVADDEQAAADYAVTLDSWVFDCDCDQIEPLRARELTVADAQAEAAQAELAL